MSSISAYMPAGRVKGQSGSKVATQQQAKARPRAAASERELVLQATKHDQAAFVQLYDRFVDKIFKYIYYRVGNQTDAEDLTSQVFMKAWQAIGRYEWTERPFAAWLYRIAHNLIVDHFRTRREAIPLEDAADLEERGASLHEILEEHLTAEALRRALHRLTPDQEQVIILRLLEGYSTTEVAAIMGKQEGAVRTLQHRALAALRLVFRQAKELA